MYLNPPFFGLQRGPFDFTITLIRDFLSEEMCDELLLCVDVRNNVILLRKTKQDTKFEVISILARQQRP